MDTVHNKSFLSFSLPLFCSFYSSTLKPFGPYLIYILPCFLFFCFNGCKYMPNLERRSKRVERRELWMLPAVFFFAWVCFKSSRNADAFVVQKFWFSFCHDKETNDSRRMPPYSFRLKAHLLFFYSYHPLVFDLVHRPQSLITFFYP